MGGLESDSWDWEPAMRRMSSASAGGRMELMPARRISSREKPVRLMKAGLTSVMLPEVLRMATAAAQFWKRPR